MPCTWHILKHLGAVPISEPRPRAHAHPAMGASQGRQFLSLHATERCFPAQTFRGISNTYLTIAFKTILQMVYLLFFFCQKEHTTLETLYTGILHRRVQKTHPSCEVVWTLCFVLFCVFCTVHFAMVLINVTCSHCLQNVFFEHLFHLYYVICLASWYRSVRTL